MTHESDLDGFVSGLLLQRLARKIFNADIRLESYHYNNWKLREPREKSGWVCDFSFEPRLDKADWLLIDHHATEVQPKNAHFIHDVTKSPERSVTNCARNMGLARRNWIAWSI